MHKLIRSSLAAGLLAAPMLANAEISANVALTSDYVWRGVSQTLEDPAIQGGFDYAHDSGFAAGVWASNVDFYETGDIDDDGADMELDLSRNNENNTWPRAGQDLCSAWSTGRDAMVVWESWHCSDGR